MQITLNMPFHPDSATDLLNAMVRAGVRLLDRDPLPLLAESGVVYEPEQPGQEVWLDPHQTYQLGKGDCEDLAIWRAAELILHGPGACLPGDGGYGGRSVRDVRVVLRQTGPAMFHAVVAYRVDGKDHIADPSSELGMGPIPDTTWRRWAVAGVTPRGARRPNRG